MSVFHLKYRPQRIADLDSVEVVEVLTRILEGGDIPPAFLFTGPKGAGKTSAARILARAVNCQKKKGIEPCGECDNCIEVGGGRSIDVLEIDAASNRGVDDARSLREKAVLLPSKLKTKVFIVDEVHMLTKEAFNALLKLIEEPPIHTMFILCTTDVSKIPETVLSRLIRVDFKKGRKTELQSALKRVIEGEKISIEDESLNLIVDKSDGSFRNIHRLFNEIVLRYGQKIKQEQVEEFFKTKGGSYSENEFEKDLGVGDAQRVMTKLEQLAEVGTDFANFREGLIRYFQERLLSFYGVGAENLGELKKEEVVRLLGCLIRAGELEKLVGIDQLPLELAVIEFLGDKEPIKKQGDSLEPKVEPMVEIKKIEGEVTLEAIEREWGNVLRVVKPFNHSVEAFLRAARPKAVEGKALVIEVFYPFHKDRLEEERNRQVVEKGLKTVLGVDLHLKCELSQSKKPPLVIKNETPMEQVTPGGEKDIYEVAKEIFG